MPPETGHRLRSTRTGEEWVVKAVGGERSLVEGPGGVLSVENGALDRSLATGKLELAGIDPWN